MIYNRNSWSAPAHIIQKLDITHGRHLRKVLKIQWPKGRISNENLCERCKTTKISDRIAKYRWTMLGQVLRCKDDTPAFMSLKFAISMSEPLVDRPSCHQTSLQIFKFFIFRKIPLLEYHDVKSSLSNRSLFKIIWMW